MNKFDDKDYYVNSLDICALCSITLTLSYKHTNISTFLDKSTEIINKLYTLYDEDKVAFYKLSSKKEIKYSSLDIMMYFLAFVVYGDVCNKQSEYRIMLSSIYKKFIINSGLIPSWPEAPTLDDYERYRGLSLNSSDMIDESYFRMPNLPSPESSGITPMFRKSITYNKKKDSFSSEKSTFDSYKNFFIFYIIIYLFKDNYINEMNLIKNDSNNINSNKNVEQKLNSDTVDNNSNQNNESNTSNLNCEDI